MRSRVIVLLFGLAFMGLLEPDATMAGPPDESGPLFPRLLGFTVPSDTGHYLGYYVGGGAGNPRKAEPRRSDEGTWGWDYQGWLLPRRVNLGWWHGRRDQDGTGAYKTDGPPPYHH